MFFTRRRLDTQDFFGGHAMKGALEKITVKGFKSIAHLDGFQLGNLNVMIGANGSGKSNFLQIFHMLMAMTQKNFSKFILERGGADDFLFNGPKVTPRIDMQFDLYFARGKSPELQSFFPRRGVGNFYPPWRIRDSLTRLLGPSKSSRCP